VWSRGGALRVWGLGTQLDRLATHRDLDRVAAIAADDPDIQCVAALSLPRPGVGGATVAAGRSLDAGDAAELLVGSSSSSLSGSRSSAGGIGGTGGNGVVAVGGAGDELQPVAWVRITGLAGRGGDGRVAGAVAHGTGAIAVSTYLSDPARGGTLASRPSIVCAACGERVRVRSADAACAARGRWGGRAVCGVCGWSTELAPFVVDGRGDPWRWGRAAGRLNF
jgi:hypothetical protein